MSYTVSTKQTPVLYGRAYLDEAQAAAQDAAQHAVATGQTLYGPGYRDVAAPVAVAVPVAEKVAPLSVRELTAALTEATPDVVLEHLAREVHREPAPRRSAVEVLQAAATRLGMDEKAAQLAQMLTELTGG